MEEIMRTFLFLTALSLVPSLAFAHPGKGPHRHKHARVADDPPPRADERGDAAVTVLLGTDTAFDGNPASLRLTVSGEGDLVRGTGAALAIALPVTVMTAGSSGPSQTAVELPPSLRLRLIPRSVVRPYGDLGLGLALLASNEGDGLFADADQTAGLMTRAALGVEIGDPDGLMFVIEPVSVRSYHVGSTYGRAGIMIGGGARF
jgi:hypothetical protein